jgi:hypothetical protein
VLKIVLIVIAVVVGLGVLAGVGFWYTAWRVSRAFHVDGQGGAVTVNVPGGGSFSAGKNVDVSEADLGVPVYPGSNREEGGLHMTMPTGSMNTAIFTTDDSVGTVVAFYKGKLGPNESDIESNTGSVLSSGKDGPNGRNGTVITVGPGTGDKSGKTQISITHTVSTQ